VKNKVLKTTLDKLDNVNLLYRGGSSVEAERLLYEILELNQIDLNSHEIKPLSYNFSNPIAITFSSLGLIAGADKQQEAIKFYTKSIEYYQQSLNSLKKYQTQAKKEIEFDISGIAYNISVMYQNLKMNEKENDNEYNREKVKEYTLKEREYLIKASLNKNIKEDLSDAMRHRLSTIYYNLGKTHESDNDLEKDLNISLNKAKEYYKLSLGFANSISSAYVPATDVFTIDETKFDIKKALKGIGNLLNEGQSSEEESKDEESYVDNARVKKLTKKSPSKAITLRSVTALNNDIPNGIAKLVEFVETFNQTLFQLWPHQRECLSNIASELNKGEKYGYVSMATGTGKTKVFSNLVTKMGMETIIIAPTTILVEQAANEIRKMAPHLDVGTIDSSYKRKGSNVTVITYASFEKMHKLDAFKNVKLIILDEVHSSLSEKRVNAIRAFQPDFLAEALRASR
jgi:RecG-like helicase